MYFHTNHELSIPSPDQECFFGGSGMCVRVCVWGGGGGGVGGMAGKGGGLALVS